MMLAIEVCQLNTVCLCGPLKLHQSFSYLTRFLGLLTACTKSNGLKTLIDRKFSLYFLFSLFVTTILYTICTFWECSWKNLHEQMCMLMF